MNWGRFLPNIRSIRASVVALSLAASVSGCYTTRKEYEVPPRPFSISRDEALARLEHLTQRSPESIWRVDYDNATGRGWLEIHIKRIIVRPDAISVEGEIVEDRQFWPDGRITSTLMSRPFRESIPVRSLHLARSRVWETRTYWVPFPAKDTELTLYGRDGTRHGPFYLRSIADGQAMVDCLSLLQKTADRDRPR